MMMNYYSSNTGRRRRVFVYRFSGAPRLGRFTKLLLVTGLIVAIPLALLLFIGLWALVVASSIVVAAAAVLGAPLLRRLRPAPRVQPQVLEGEARRIDVDS
jgi:membrane protein implicated in regulation of membrane protease activity